jgi:hypothetical protein
VILAAALLVLVGLGFFVGGILTGATVLYWLCVAACVAAGIFLVLARTRMGRTPAGATAAGASTAGDAAVPTDAPAAPAAEPFPPAAPAWERTASRAWESAAAPVGDPAAPPVAEPVAGEHSIRPPVEPSTAAHTPRGPSGAVAPSGEPPVEEVEVTDLLLVVDLRDEVLVVDEHPRYHVGGCRWLAGRETIPLPMDEARTDGFTPCGWCEPDRTLAERERGRRAGRRS